MSSLTFLTKHHPDPLLPDDRRKGRVAVFFITVSLLFLSCGLPQDSYIYSADSDEERDIDWIFTFDHDKENGTTIFEGYRFYYRFFSNTEYEISTQDETFLTYLISLASSDLNSTNIKNPASYEDKKYRRLFISPSGSSEDPSGNSLVIPGELRGQPLSFSIDFSSIVLNPAEPGYPVLSCDSLPSSYNLFRYEDINPDSFIESFVFISFIPYDFIDGQSDLPDAIFDAPLDEKTFYISLFVVPYGRDSNLTTHFGETITLGYITLKYRF